MFLLVSFLLKMICVDLVPYLYIFNFSTHAWCRVHYAIQIILQLCFVLVNISSFIPVFINTFFSFDVPDPFLEDGFDERYFNTHVVINDEGASIPLDRCGLSLPNCRISLVGLYGRIPLMPGRTRKGCLALRAAIFSNIKFWNIYCMSPFLRP